jgi:L-fuconolactonase
MAEKGLITGNVLDQALASVKASPPMEAAIEPDLPIIDPHHHLRERPNHRYLLHELLRDITSGHNIQATVAVESTAMYRDKGPEEMRPVGETEFLNGIAAMSASGIYGPARVCAAIIGFADFRLGDRVKAVLEAHIAAGGGRFRGIRNTVVWDDNEELKNTRGTNSPHILRDAGYRRGIACLAPLELVYEVNLFFHQLGDLVELATAFPNTTIVLNHLGKPVHTGPYAGKDKEVMTQWKSGLKELARRPNTVIKVGGLGQDTLGLGIHEEKERPKSERLVPLWRPYIEACVEAFGPERAMFESNFPPDKKTCDYTVLWNGIKRVAAQYSAVEKAALFKGTAARVYGLHDI